MEGVIMHKQIIIALIAVLMSIQKCDAGAIVLAKDYPIQPVSFTDVKVTDKFWAPRIETNRKVTIPHIFVECEKTGRIDNFAIAGGLMEGKHRGSFPFDDTDLYKVIEGASYSLSARPDAKLEKELDELIVKIAAAQEDDGYLYTCRKDDSKRLINWYGEQRWSKLDKSHELYNMGHLYEAAIAHYQATGKRALLDVAIKNAELLDTVFGPGKNETAPGHQIIEMALVRLYQTTGNEKYLKLAKFFLDTRGPGGSEYNQSHEKVIEQSEAVGHAVRAVYMYCGMADVAAMTGDKSYLRALDRIWKNVVAKKLYITGGIGAEKGGEAFGKDYELPNADAYCETCAAVGNCFWNYRMFLSHGDAKYIDVLERTLYNGLLSGVSLSGDKFFYPNPLESRGNYRRSPWFTCACCPGNIARFIPTVPGYIYAHNRDKLYVNLFVNGSGTILMKDNAVRIRQKTRYPWDGQVVMTVEPRRSDKFTICVRIPGWAQNQPVPSDLYRFADNSDEKVRLSVNGGEVALDIERGFVCIERTWKKGDVIELNLPMPVRRVVSCEKVHADTERVALQRGPIVYCAEGIDNGGRALGLMLPDGAELKAEYEKKLLGGVTVIRGKAVALNDAENKASLAKKEQDFMAIPYCVWANRKTCDMAVWLARNELAVEQVRAAVKIDATKTSEPISKYIYGQFIEHLGRCIYGGIWAEMLEDRKFYFPITADYDPYRSVGGVRKTDPFAVVGASPWQIIGGADSVVMVKEDSFVGEHTPLIQPDSGIRQLDLGLVKNKQYVGYIYLKARQRSTNVSISLIWSDQPKDRDVVHITADANEYIKFPLQFTAGADTTNGKLEIKVADSACLVGTVSLMPADNIDGMRADTLGLLKELNATMYRWPGGNFVSGYDWRDGIGDRDRRPPRKNPAWTGVEHNDFGFHEFIHFCRLLGAEPLVTVNTGFGDAYSAAAQLEYANGSADTIMGSLRAKNGEPEPFNLRYWCIGNEMWGNWQLGYMKMEHYVLKHNWVVDKMREVDPNIITIASGNAGPWSKGLLQHCSNHIDLIAEHFYCKEKSDLIEHASQIADNIKQKVQFHQQLRRKLDTLKGKDIQVAMTEWNYWYGPYLFGELGTRYFHKDALGIAKGLHEYFRHSDMMFLASYAQTVNVIGCIKTSKTDAAFATTALPLKLYRNHFGTIPVGVAGDVSPLDVSAAWTSGKEALTIGIVNPSERKYEITLDLQGVKLADTGKCWLIASSDPMAYNEPGKEPQVVIEEKSLADVSNTLNVPPLSICLYKLKVSK
jgi:DUF1680 family protein/alpha-L-arabinofuranosidase